MAVQSAALEAELHSSMEFVASQIALGQDRSATLRTQLLSLMATYGSLDEYDIGTLTSLGRKLAAGPWTTEQKKGIRGINRAQGTHTH